MLRNLDEVVYANQLWQIQVGHSWAVFRIPSGNVDAAMGKIRKSFAAAKIQFKRRISNALELRALARAAGVDDDRVLSRLDAKPTDCDYVLGIKIKVCDA